jgi:hypothetical protein
LSVRIRLDGDPSGGEPGHRSVEEGDAVDGVLFAGALAVGEPGVGVDGVWMWV